jgi:hypothetical protein
MQSESNQQYEKLDQIISDDEVVKFRRILKNFINTGELSASLLSMQPGVYQINEEPLKGFISTLSHASDRSIKIAIAENRNEFYTNIDGAKISDHKYNYMRLSKYANEKCACDIELAIEQIVDRDKQGGFVFIDDDLGSCEKNLIIQEGLRFIVNKAKRILWYHPTYCID